MKEYIVPCNLRNFDIIKHAENNEGIIWKQPQSCSVGDTVFIYVGVPYSRILYRCVVTKIQLESSPYVMEPKSPARNCKYMELIFEHVLKDDNPLTLRNLQKHGLKTVQCATTVSDDLHLFIVKHLDT